MAGYAISVEDVNLMSHEAFVGAFGDIAEHSPWVAEVAAHARPFADRSAMIGAFLDAILEAPPAKQLALVRAHPDLAGKAAIAGELLPDSRKEQAGAGLDRLTPEEFARFSKLNNTYREMFGFPFIYAVKGSDKHAILAAFEARIGNEPEAELATAIRQVGNIVTFRLEDRIAG